MGGADGSGADAQVSLLYTLATILCYSLAVVGVNANKSRSINGPDVVDLHGALVLGATVAAATVELAEVVHVEGIDDNRSTTVVLDDCRECYCMRG